MRPEGEGVYIKTEFWHLGALYTSKLELVLG
jgi:hypothetical protein